MHGIHGFAVDVELELLGRAVADPHRERTPIALPVVERLLDQVRASVDPVHDGQRRGTAGWTGLEPVAHPSAERRSLLGVAQTQQGVDGERGVTDPREAVVPVAFATDLLGQTSGWGRHQSAARRVGHELEGDGRALDHLAPPAPVAAAAHPFAPEGRGLLEQVDDLAVAGAGGRATPGLEQEPAEVTGLDGEAGSHGALVACQRVHRRESQHQVVGGEASGPAVHPDPVRPASVVEARLDAGVELDLAPDPLDHPHQPMPIGHLVRTVDGHEVQHLGHTRLRGIARDQDGRVGQVHLLGHACPHRWRAVRSGRPPGRRAGIRTRWASRSADNRTSRSCRRSTPGQRSAGHRSVRDRRWRGSSSLCPRFALWSRVDAGEGAWAVTPRPADRWRPRRPRRPAARAGRGRRAGRGPGR